MNKQLIAAPLLLSLAGLASAQSSVTLYGIVDAGVTYRSNERVGTAGAYTGHSNVGLTTGNLSGSRWGIKGSEDLGGGLRALFVLENGFDITNGTSGQGGRQFGRQAFV
ncbi:porin, partial [Burkholderia multivorans]